MLRENPKIPSADRKEIAKLRLESWVPPNADEDELWAHVRLRRTSSFLSTGLTEEEFFKHGPVRLAASMSKATREGVLSSQAMTPAERSAMFYRNVAVSRRTTPVNSLQRTG